MTDFTTGIPAPGNGGTAPGLSTGFPGDGFAGLDLGSYARIIEAPVNPRDYGAVYDNITDDSAAIQAALNAAGAATVQGFRAAEVYSPGAARFSGTLLVPSGVKFRSSLGAPLTHTSAGVPAIASQSWKSSLGVSPTGYAVISGIRVVGAGGAGEHAFLLRDFFSLIEDCEADSPGGDGFHLTDLNDVGGSTAGTLVENQLRRLKATTPAGTGCYIGADANNKLTDGVIDSFICHLAAGSPYGLYIGSAAGWDIATVHLYGGASAAPVTLSRCFYTALDDVYIENHTGAGVSLPQYQDGLTATDLRILMPNIAGLSALSVPGSDGTVANPGGSVVGLVVRQDNAVATYAVNNAVAGLMLRASGVLPTGTARSSIQYATGAGPVRIGNAAHGRANLSGQGGDYALTASYTAPLADLTVDAQVGDWLEVGISAVVNNGAGDFLADAATVVGGSSVNFVSGWTAAGNGVGAWYRPGGGYAGSGGSILYQVAAADISAGQVTMRFLAKSPGARSILVTSTNALVFWVRKLS